MRNPPHCLSPACPPRAHARSYDSAFVQRSGGRRDGCATFWRAARLRATRVRKLRFHDYDLSDNVALLVALQPLDMGICGVAAQEQAAAGGGGGGGSGGGAGVEADGEEADVGLLIANTHVSGGWVRKGRGAPLRLAQLQTKRQGGPRVATHRGSARRLGPRYPVAVASPVPH